MKSAALSWFFLAIVGWSALMASSMPAHSTGLQAKSLIDLGEVPPEQEVKTTVELRNTGPKDVTIHSIVTSCRCVLPKTPKMFVAANGKLLLEIVVSAGQAGDSISAQVLIRYTIGTEKTVYVKVIRVNGKAKS